MISLLYFECFLFLAQSSQSSFQLFNLSNEVEKKNSVDIAIKTYNRNKAFLGSKTASFIKLSNCLLHEHLNKVCNCITYKNGIDLDQNFFGHMCAQIAFFICFFPGLHYVKTLL